MTVSDIKDYINSQLEPLARLNGIHQAMNYNACLLEVLSMLDELELMTNKDYMNYKGYNGVTPKDYDENAPINLQDIEVIDLLKEIKALKE